VCRSLHEQAGVVRQHRYLMWHGGDGRLLLIDRRPAAELATEQLSPEGEPRTRRGRAAAHSDQAWCTVSEAALVHLQQHKFKHFGAMPSFDARGFVFDRDKGIQPASALLNGSSNHPMTSAARLLVRPVKDALGGNRCNHERVVKSIVERSMF